MLLVGDIAAKSRPAVIGQQRVQDLLSGGHFSADGTLIDAGAA
ncbi:hypothetical protein [Sphingobium baderi]|uniref:Uncharacterized protein n=1 Tax=Sphingobium baderi LL03 TaxID=1114964 RepID=T0GVP3_9SPHN|nr:hypothetical protein [Sphingobium baderi]EQB04737.1 hypothetical protein L485_03830 [Sphingobium baderi LL03]KMS51619.1 hypothetical protein V475_22290 [Sphingobium baderi LL03]